MPLCIFFVRGTRQQAVFRVVINHWLRQELILIITLIKSQLTVHQCQYLIHIQTYIRQSVPGNKRTSGKLVEPTLKKFKSGLIRFVFRYCRGFILVFFIMSFVFRHKISSLTRLKYITIISYRLVYVFR